MSIIVDGGGRFGNQFIRNIAINFITSKFDLSCIYQSNDLMKELGIELYSGNKLYNDDYVNVIIKNENLITLLNQNILNFNIIKCDDYYQTKEISNMIQKYLHKDVIKQKIIQKNGFKDRYNNNNDIFIHIRLGDVSEYNPGLKYYICALSEIKSYDNIYISTDSPDHYIVQQLLEKYQIAKIINYNEVETFQFGSTCKNIILSHGSFSANIGYLAFYSTIYYAEYNPKRIWYGDMFSIEEWNKIPLESYL
jgi:hypothetical protein